MNIIEHNISTSLCSILHTIGAVRLSPVACVPQHFQRIGHVHVVMLEEVVHKVRVVLDALQIVRMKTIWNN